jgi:hypothetical protein
MTFRKGQSGNPSGRPVYRLPDGRTLTDLAREYTEEAVEALVDVMREGDSDAARVAAAKQILDRGWGQAPQTIAVQPVEAPLDLSEMNNEQIEAIRTLRALAPLDAGPEPIH